MRYALNPQEARAAEASPRITETGAYTGVFTKALAVTAKSGAAGIEFEFKDSATDASADFLTVYTHKADGSAIRRGNGFISALMTCLKLREITDETGTVELWDDTQKKKVPQQASIYPALMNRPIGVLLQAEEYFTGSGEPRQRMTLAGFYEASTRLMATEILDKKATPHQLDKFIASMPAVRKAKSPAPQTGYQQAQQTGAPDTSMDDIPF